MNDTSHLVFTTVNPHTNETVYAEFGEREVWALAQIVKRLGFSDCRSNAVDDDEAYQMTDALGKVQCFLAEAGVAPR